MTLQVELTNNLNGRPLVLSDAAIRILAEWIVAAYLKEMVEEGAAEKEGAVTRLEAAPLNT